MSIEIHVNVGDLKLTDPIDTKVVYDDDTEERYEKEILLGDVVVAKLVEKATEGKPWASLTRRVAEIRDEEIKAAVAPLVADALVAGIQKTNSYGEPIGQPTTLRELLMKAAEDTLKGFTDRSGSWPREHAPLAQQLVQKLVYEELRKELGEVIEEERTKVREAVREQAARLIAESVTKGVGGK